MKSNKSKKNNNGWQPEDLPVQITRRAIDFVRAINEKTANIRYVQSAIEDHANWDYMEFIDHEFKLAKSRLENMGDNMLVKDYKATLAEIEKEYNDAKNGIGKAEDKFLAQVRVVQQNNLVDYVCESGVSREIGNLFYDTIAGSPEMSPFIENIDRIEDAFLDAKKHMVAVDKYIQEKQKKKKSK